MNSSQYLYDKLFTECVEALLSLRSCDQLTNCLYKLGQGLSPTTRQGLWCCQGEVMWANNLLLILRDSLALISHVRDSRLLGTVRF